MPKFKEPVVEISNVDFGEFHPTAQILTLTDLDKGGVFRGIGFELQISKQQARQYMRYTEQMKPEQRMEIDATIMKDKTFAKQVFTLCGNQK